LGKTPIYRKAKGEAEKKTLFRAETQTRNLSHLPRRVRVILWCVKLVILVAVLALIDIALEGNLACRITVMMLAVAFWAKVAAVWGRRRN